MPAAREWTRRWRRSGAGKKRVSPQALPEYVKSVAGITHHEGRTTMYLPHTLSEDRGRRATLLLILGIAILVPSLAWPGAEGFYGIRPVIIQGVALGLLLLLASRATWSPEDLRRFLRTGPNLPILLFLGWSAISCLHSSDRAHGLQQLLQIVGGAIVYFAVVYRVSSRRQ